MRCLEAKFPISVSYKKVDVRETISREASFKIKDFAKEILKMGKTTLTMEFPARELDLNFLNSSHMLDLCTAFFKRKISAKIFNIFIILTRGHLFSF